MKNELSSQTRENIRLAARGADAILDDLIAVRRDIHAHPEQRF